MTIKIRTLDVKIKNYHDACEHGSMLITTAKK